MRWSGAFLALFLCLVVCLLVVALRVRTLQFRAQLCALQKDASYVAAERSRCIRQIAWLRRTEVLRSKSIAEQATTATRD